MVFALLISAIVWNVGTWYLGLPASSSHTLIGSILGVGLANSVFSGVGFGNGAMGKIALRPLMHWLLKVKPLKVN
jgi:phosphate/sulfate permease